MFCISHLHIDGSSLWPVQSICSLFISQYPSLHPALSCLLIIFICTCYEYIITITKYIAYLRVILIPKIISNERSDYWSDGISELWKKLFKLPAIFAEFLKAITPTVETTMVVARGCGLRSGNFRVLFSVTSPWR